MGGGRPVVGSEIVVGIEQAVDNSNMVVALLDLGMGWVDMGNSVIVGLGALAAAVVLQSGCSDVPAVVKVFQMKVRLLEVPCRQQNG